jgi:hypothetical protein
VTFLESDFPSFSPAGTLRFEGWEGDSKFIYALKPSDAMPQKISAEPGPSWCAVSPDGEWCVTTFPSATAQPLLGGPKIRICDFCDVGWGPGDKFFYVRLREMGEIGGGKVYVFALPVGKSLPALPPSGIKSAEDFKGLNIVSVIDMTGLSVFASRSQSFHLRLLPDDCPEESF